MSSPPTAFYFPAPRAQRFCTQCGTPLSQIVPPDDNRLRDACGRCGAIHYQNPRNVVGVLPVWENKVLLCRRAIEPRYNTWTLPAGFMELGETTAQGAMRETQEEAGAQIQLGELYTIIDVPHAEQVHFFYLAKVLSPDLYPGPESLDARFFSLEAIPWDDLSFLTVITTLRHYLADVDAGVFPMRHYQIDHPATQRSASGSEPAQPSIP